MSQQPNPSASVPSGRGFSLVNVVLLTLPLLAIAGILLYALENPGRKPAGQNIGKQVKEHLARGVATTLDPTFVDADNDLVADAPAQPLDPPTIVFTTLEARPEIWKGFVAFLHHRLGRPVQWRHELASLGDLTRKFKAGDIHVAAVSTGTVPTLVNAAGFVPTVCMADDKGAYAYRAVIVVPASSPVKTLADLKGRKLTLTSISSLSSFKAPIVMLAGAGLDMDKDYEVVFSRSQRDSIEGLADGRYDAIAVASDLLDRAIKSNKLDGTKFRTIHQSNDDYPPACFGYHHALKKELADEIRKAFVEYTWDAALKEEFAPADYSKFVAISYKKDWDAVRKIDEQFKNK